MTSNALESGSDLDCVIANSQTIVPDRLIDVSLRETMWHDVNLSGRQISGLKCRDSRFVRCDLSGVVLDRADLARVIFEDCRMTGVHFVAAKASDVQILGGRADLANFRMMEAHRMLADDVSLHSADFYSSTLQFCAITDCDLTEANFQDARVSGLHLHGSTIDGLRGVLSLGGSRVSPDQVVPLGAAILAATGIQVTDPPGRHER